MQPRPVPVRYMDFLRQHLPGVEGSSLRLDESGLANDVVVVDESLVVRFAKHEWSAGVMAAEGRVLMLAARRLSVPVPAWEGWAKGVVAYPFLPGRALEAADLQTLPAAGRRLIAGEVARFLRELQAIPTAEALAAGIGDSDARCPAEAWEGLMGKADHLLPPTLDVAGRAEMSRLFAAVRGGVLDDCGEEALIHGDLAACHLLWDGSTPRLAGVIDFGCAGLGDPALDVAALYEVYGEEFLEHLVADLPGYEARLDRVRAFAGLYRLQSRVDEMNGSG